MNILMKSHEGIEWNKTTLENFLESVEITRDLIIELAISDRDPKEYEEKYALGLLRSGRVVDTPAILFKLGEGNNTTKCPICGSFYMGMGALSRRDNKTDICSQCGMDEAIEDMKF